MEQSDFDLHHIYRGLGVLAENMDYIQAELYKRSQKLIKRNTGVLFYDCTNFFFEMEQESGLKQYGPSKENRPNPIVQMVFLWTSQAYPWHSASTPETKTNNYL